MSEHKHRVVFVTRWPVDYLSGVEWPCVDENCPLEAQRAETKHWWDETIRVQKYARQLETDFRELRDYNAQLEARNEVLEKFRNWIGNSNVHDFRFEERLIEELPPRKEKA